MHTPNTPSELINSTYANLFAETNVSGFTPAQKAYHVLIASMTSGGDLVELLGLVVDGLHEGCTTDDLLSQQDAKLLNSMRSVLERIKDDANELAVLTADRGSNVPGID